MVILRLTLHLYKKLGKGVDYLPPPTAVKKPCPLQIQGKKCLTPPPPDDSQCYNHVIATSSSIYIYIIYPQLIMQSKLFCSKFKVCTIQSDY